VSDVELTTIVHAVAVYREQTDVAEVKVAMLQFEFLEHAVMQLNRLESDVEINCEEVLLSATALILE
jgi:hypothetical protein